MGSGAPTFFNPWIASNISSRWNSVVVFFLFIYLFIYFSLAENNYKAWHFMWISCYWKKKYENAVFYNSTRHMYLNPQSANHNRVAQIHYNSTIAELRFMSMSKSCWLHCKNSFPFLNCLVTSVITLWYGVWLMMSADGESGFILFAYIVWIP